MEGTGKKFMEMTRYAHMADSPERQGKKQPPVEPPADTAALIPLPDAHASGFGGESLIDLINGRRSLRRYGEGALSAAELSFLLWCCQGVQEKSEKYTLRTVPSAGARHAFETFVLVNRVEGLPCGLYRYSALNHALLPSDLSQDITERLTGACLNQGMIRSAAVSVFWTAELSRMYHRYGERGYRYLHLDTGHACQNLYLAAGAVGAGACAIGAFDDESLNGELGLDGENQFVVYAATVGKKP